MRHLTVLLLKCHQEGGRAPRSEGCPVPRSRLLPPPRCQPALPPAVAVCRLRRKMWDSRELSSAGEASTAADPSLPGLSLQEGEQRRAEGATPLLCQLRCSVIDAE